jgi:hypothetical protein
MTRINADTKERRQKNLGQKDEGLENRRSRQQIHFFAADFFAFRFFYVRILSARIRVIRGPPLFCLSKILAARDDFGG